MKKLLILAVLLLLLVPAGCASSSPQAAVTRGASAEPPSAALQAAQASDGVPAADAVPSQTFPAQPEELARAAVNLDWSRYRLKDVGSKTVGGKSYSAFEIWDDDYHVGPFLLVDSSGGAVYAWTAADSAPVPAAEDKAFDKTLRTVTGVMEDGAMMSVTIRTDDGYRLTVRRLGIDTTGLKSMVAGDRIKVTYTGVIAGGDTTRAFIVKLENDK